MGPKDKKILNRLQENFPLDLRPYKSLAKDLKMSEGEVLGRLKKLMGDRIIRRFGILIDHKALGYYSTLLGVRLDSSKLPGLLSKLLRSPEITHCYEREGDYNLWFTFLTPKLSHFNKFLAKLKKAVGAKNILNLPTKRNFKLKTTFRIK